MPRSAEEAEPVRPGQPRVRVEHDPARVRELAEAKEDENASLRAFLNWGPLPGSEVDRLCPIVFGVLERLKAELDERGHDWRGEPAGPSFPI